MKILISLILVFFVTLNSFSMAWAEDAVREAQLIKGVQAAKVKYGELSEEHMQAMFELENLYKSDKAYRQKHKKLIADLINRVEAKYGKDTKIVDDAKLGLAEMHMMDKEYPDAIFYLEDMKNAYMLEAAKINPETKSKSAQYSPKLCVVLVNLANSFINVGRYEDAEFELHQFFQKIKSRDDSEGLHSNNRLITLAYESLADVAVHNNQPTKAQEYLKNSLAIFEKDGSLPRHEYAGTNAMYEKLKNLINKGDTAASTSSSFVHSIEVSNNYQSRLDKEDIDGAIKVLEEHKVELEKNASQDYYELGYCYLQLALNYNQKHEDFLLESKKQKNYASINQSKWLDLTIFSAQKSVIAFQHVPYAEPYISASLSLIGLIEFSNEVGNMDEINSILHASIRYATQRGPENILVAGSQALLSVTYAAKNQPDLSIFWGKQAINTLQTIKQNEEDLDADFKELFAIYTRMVYEVVPMLMFYQGRSAEAQQVLQMLKERELYEAVRDAADDPRKMRLKYNIQEQAALDSYNRYLKQIQVQNNRKTPKSYEDFSKEIKNRLVEIDDAVKLTPSKAMQNSASVINETTALQKTINNLAKSEPKAAAIGIQYLVTKGKLIIVLNVPNAQPIFKEVPITYTSFYQNVVLVTKQIQNPKTDAKYYSPALKELYGLLITPILPELKKYKAKTLMLSLDSQLRLLPFGALMDSNNHYLLENYTIAIYNEAANQALEKPSNPKWRVAAMGLSKSVNGLKALSAVPSELAGILKTSGLEGDEYLDATFTRGQFIDVTKATNSKPYNVLHVASHFELQPSDPGESSLYMGDGSKFSLKEMSAIPLNFKNFDLVTYSACQTAVTGSNDGSGKEVESLSAQTQRQGAQAVMATLWKVSDQSTAKLMQDYYTQRNQGLNKAEALRVVQLNMALGKAANTDWKSPHHWAGFVISGNWR